jgi:hypothetical protein
MPSVRAVAIAVDGRLIGSRSLTTDAITACLHSDDRDFGFSLLRHAWRRIWLSAFAE